MTLILRGYVRSVNLFFPAFERIERADPTAFLSLVYVDLDKPIRGAYVHGPAVQREDAPDALVEL